MPEYRAVRARLGFLELCKNPDAAAEVTLQPVERLGVDAAILFADILLVLEPLGVGLEFTAGDGPRIARPVRARGGRAGAARGGRRGRGRLRVRDGAAGAQGARRPRAPHRLRGGAVHARLLPDRGRAVARVPPHQDVHAAGARGVGRDDDAARGHHRRVPERADRGGRPGGAALRLVGGRALARRLPRLRAPALAPRDRRAAARRAGHPLRRGHRRAAAAHEGGGRRRDRARLARGARAHVGPPRPRRGGAGQPRPRGAAGRRARDPPRGRARSSTRRPGARATSSTSGTASTRTRRSST